MKTRKIISLITLVAMLFSMSVYSVAEANTIDYTNAYGLMNELGVFKGETDSDAPVTRRDLAVYAARIVGVSGIGEAFKDVAHDDEDIGSIGAVSGIGLMTGSDGYFYPDRELTLNEAATVMMRIAGYESAAQEAGGFAGGYMTWALNTKLLNGISSNSGAITHGDVAVMLYNLMHIKLLDAVAYYGDGTKKETISREETVLNRYFDCVCWNGTIVATEDAAIWGRARSGDSTIVINSGGSDYVYKANSGDFDLSLGRSARFYTRIDSQDIVYSEFIDGGCETGYILGENITDTDRALSFIKYTDEYGKTKTLDTDNAVFVYNGREHRAVTQEMLQPAAGQDGYTAVEWVDADSDNKVDIVYVWYYDVVMVENINFTNYKIIDRLTGKIISFDPSDCTTTVLMNGDAFDLSDIQEGFTLLVAQSLPEGSEYKLTINVFSDSVDGQLTAKSDDAVEIDGERFTLRPNLSADGLTLNERYVVGIDYNGNALCAVAKESWPQKYGYVLNIGKKLGMDEQIQIKMFTENNKIEILDFADKFKLNGLSAKYSDIEASNLFDSGSFKEQLISYTLNSDGKIKEINVSDGVAYTPVDGDNPTFKLNKKMDPADTSEFYRHYDNTGLFDGEYLSSSAVTRNFLIIKDSNNKTVESELYVGTAADMRVESGRFDISIYDSTYERVAGAVVYNLTASDISGGESDIYGYVVSSVKDILDDDGEVVKELTGYSQGQEMKLRETESIKFTGIREGDILMTWNIASELLAYKKMFSLDEATFGDAYIGYDSDSYKFDPNNYPSPVRARVSGYYAEILSKSNADTNIYLTKTRGGDIIPQAVSTYTNYYIYDTERDTLSYGDVSDLSIECKNVYFVNTYGIARDAVIYK